MNSCREAISTSSCGHLVKQRWDVQTFSNAAISSKSEPLSVMTKSPLANKSITCFSLLKSSQDGGSVVPCLIHPTLLPPVVKG